MTGPDERWAGTRTASRAVSPADSGGAVGAGAGDSARAGAAGLRGGLRRRYSLLVGCYTLPDQPSMGGRSSRAC
ncbi:hypothetical protein [Streptomyces sp. NPDC051576]|uniref:hypothetical protein n=1 Tax=Streptomyces sp. NPDC051576 TaxID=3155803 RepID=UPI0034442F41